MANEVVSKKWYQSKTLWFNIITLVLSTLDTLSGSGFIKPEIYAIIVAIGNVVLRLWFTDKPVTP